MIVNWNDSANVSLTLWCCFSVFVWQTAEVEFIWNAVWERVITTLPIDLKAPFYKTFHSAAAAASLHFDVSILFFTRNSLRCAGASFKVCIDPSMPYFSQKLTPYIITW